MRAKRPSPPYSLTLRITLLFTAAACTVLLALGLLIGNAVEQHFIEQDMEQLTGKTHLTAHLLAQMQSADDLLTLPQQLDASLVGHHALALLVLDANQHRLFATEHAPFPEKLLQTASHGPQIWQQDGHPWRGMVSRLPTGNPQQPPLRVAVAVDISHHQHFMDSFRQTLWLFVTAALVALGLLGWIVVRRGLAPLQTMRQDAAAITANHLDNRLSMAEVPQELAALAETLNDMLARLEESFQRLKDFSSDLAHELRTPISNLMTETQVALTRARSPDEYREVLASNAEEYERLARMISDMLFLAQADNGLLVPNRETVDLAAQISELFDFFDALAEEKSLKLTSTGTASITGDKLMLRRALANLLANAIRHTPHGGDIAVRIESESDGVRLCVDNRGEPIPPEHLPRLFDRFYRADPSRHNNSEGAGLGLAITRAIIRAHGGEIKVRNKDGRVCFEMRLG